MLRDLRKAGRLLTDLRQPLREPFDEARALAGVRERLARRGESFLRLLERGVFARPDSPYRALMSAAGAELGDIARTVDRDGVEAALAELYDAGVHISLDEFKGRRPLRRLGLDLAVRARDFDNPFARAHYEGSTGGSRGPATRLIIDLDLLAYETAHVHLALAAQGALERPAAVWRPAPPGVTGLKEVFYRVRLGREPERWFCQNRPLWRPSDARSAAMTACLLGGSRLWGRPLPRPRHVPLDRAHVILDWIVAKKRQHQAPLVDANVSTVIRVCRAARDNGVDIAGTLFRTGGEAYTSSRAALVAGAGCRAACSYGISETGRIGMACGDPAHHDDVHVLGDKVALLSRERPVSSLDRSVDALYLTTLHPSAPKLMLNVEIGDHARRTRRRCGCPFGALGFEEHLDTIRSYEKLTSEGMHFVGADIVELLERTLPARFGGGPNDYQLVEREIDGLVRVFLIASPRLGPLDEGALTRAALESLRHGGEGHAMMSAWWRKGGVLGILRREPYTTPALKVLPLHVLRDEGAR